MSAKIPKRTLISVFILSCLQITCVSKNGSSSFKFNGDRLLLSQNFSKSISAAISKHNRLSSASLDQNAVPHVSGKSEEDVYFAQGFTHAYFRLWQMETLIRLTEGSLAELIGERGLELDRSAFQFGFDELAQKSYRQQISDTRLRGILEAYVDGINSRIDQLSNSELPTEYRKLGIRPRKFTSMDIVRISYSKNALLLDPFVELRLSRTHTKLPPEIFEEVFPWPLRHNEEAQLFGRVTTKMPARPKSKAVISLDEIPRDSLRNTWVRSRPDTGSNAWAIGTAQSADGRSLIANDYHMHFHLPGLYIPFGLNVNGQVTLGASVPGQPGIFGGSNGKVGFGFVASLVDTSDWYRLKISPRDPNMYFWNGKYRKFKVEKKIINVRSAGTAELVRRTSAAGPMIDGLRNSVGESVPLAYRWAGKQARNFLLPPVNLPKISSSEACGEDEMITNLGWFVFTCVDISGRQGVWVTGPIPKRNLRSDPRILSEATSDKDIWHNFIEVENNPSVFPVQGFVALGNQKIISNHGPEYIGWNFSPPIRAIRMNALFSERQNVSLDDVESGQADIKDSRTDAVREKLIELSGKAGFLEKHHCERRIRSEVIEWDGDFDRESYRARLFNEWLKRIHSKLWTLWIGEQNTFEWPSAWRTIELLTAEVESRIWKLPGGRENTVSAVLSEICADTFANDVGKIPEYQWQFVSRPTFRSLFGQVHPDMKKLRVAGGAFSLFSQMGDHGTVFRWVAKVKSPPDFKFAALGGIDGDSESLWSTNWSTAWSNRELISVVPPVGLENE